MSSRKDMEGPTLSIGALSKTTGIPAETLRTWERRYGFPQPKRSPGGHRIYSAEIIDELKLIRDALQQGYRAKQVMNLGEQALLTMLGRQAEPATTQHYHDDAWPSVQGEPSQSSSRLTQEFGGPAEQVSQWLEMGRRQDAQGLERSLQRCWYMCGSMMFLQHYISPLVVEVGEAWSRDELTVGEEHFISERVRDFLTAQWRPMSARARGTKIMCANLPGERHTLGLHMVATVLALHGCQIIFLGADVPMSELAGMTSKGRPEALCVSLSLAADRKEQERQLQELSERLDPSVRVLLGGGGAQRLTDYEPKTFQVVHTLIELEQWLITRRS